METKDRLKILRNSLGLSQREIAEKIGVTRSNYVKYENGTTSPILKIQELADLFNVSTDYLLGRDSELIRDKIGGPCSLDELITLAPDEKTTRLLSAYSKLPEDKQRQLVGLAYFLLNDDYSN